MTLEDRSGHYDTPGGPVAADPASVSHPPHIPPPLSSRDVTGKLQQLLVSQTVFTTAVQRLEGSQHHQAQVLHAFQQEPHMEVTAIQTQQPQQGNILTEHSTRITHMMEFMAASRSGNHSSRASDAASTTADTLQHGFIGKGLQTAGNVPDTRSFSQCNHPEVDIPEYSLLSQIKLYGWTTNIGRQARLPAAKHIVQQFATGCTPIRARHHSFANVQSVRQ